MTEIGSKGGVRKVFVHTFGCQMNVYDSRRMVQLLGEDGADGERYEETRRPDEADLILINTCSVREKPQAKVMSALGRYVLLRSARPDLLIGITGCVAAQEKERLLVGRPAADLVVGPDALAELPALVARARRERVRQLSVAEQPPASYAFVEARPLGDEGVTAMVTAIKGCNSYCSYCIVPYVRGREVSKPAAQIRREVERLVGAGVREVMLLGQNVNRYGLDLAPEGPTFASLLRSVAEVPGLARLRFTTSHPRDFADDLVACFGTVGPLCEYLHLPVQSGSDATLARMNRGYTRADYVALVGRLRAACPTIHLSTDIIVGFPGESDEEFEETLSLLATLRLGTLFAFKYSARPGTAAAALSDDVSEETKARRLAAAQALQASFSTAALEAHVGREVEVLVEGSSRTVARNNGQLTGRTRTNFIVNFSGVSAEAARDATGLLARVRVERAEPHSLAGRVVALENRGGEGERWRPFA